MLDENTESYILLGMSGVSLSSLACSMGVDVGAKQLDVRISDHPRDFVRRARFIGKVSWVDLPELVRAFNVTICVIDEEPERSKVLELIDKLPCRVIACCTRNVASADTIPEIDKVAKDIDEKRITIDKTIWQDRVQQTFIRRQNWIPKNFRSLSDGLYLTEMTTPTRVIDIDNAGRQKFVWTSGNDHSFMADVYDLVATTLGFSANSLGSMVDASGPAVFDVSGVRRWISSGRVLEWG